MVTRRGRSKNGRIEVRLSLFEASNGRARLVGHEMIRGRMASIYTWTNNADTVMPETIRAWMADDDLRPLAMEAKLQELVPVFDKEPGTRTTVATYEYDPAIKVTLPTP